MSIQDEVRQFHHSEPGATDPSGLYERMRKTCPVARSERAGGFWLLSKHSDIDAMLRRRSTSARHTAVPPDPSQPRLLPINYDGPEHTAYRHEFRSWFSTVAVATIAARFRESARQRITAFAEAGGGDAVAAICVPLPSEGFLEFVGLPLDDLDQLLKWKDELLREVFSGESTSAKQADPAMFSYFAAALQKAAGEAPNDSIASRLTRASHGGVPLTSDEQVLAMTTFMIAGLDTTTNVLAHSLEFLADHPEQRAQLIDDPSLITPAIDEFVRYFGLVTITRTAAEDMEIGGCRFAKGDALVLPTRSANHDTTVFPKPDTVDFRRSNTSRHLGFGAGVHVCLGMHLARLELRIALEVILEVMPQYKINGNVTRYFGSINTIEHLPLSVIDGA
jgi:cytochrome P450